ncbi:MAG: hypothetical protein WAM53_08055 [Terrimicrobiaceae bacterium]
MARETEEENVANAALDERLGQLADDVLAPALRALAALLGQTKGRRRILTYPRGVRKLHALDPAIQNEVDII